MKRVVLLKSEARSNGGLEKYAERIAASFAQRGNAVQVLTNNSFQTVKWPGFLRLEQFDRAVEKWLKNHPADIIFGMDRTRTQTHLRAGNGVHAAYLESRLHTEGRLKYCLSKFNPLHRKILELEKSAFENPRLQKLFANSHMVRKQILERYATDPKKVEVIHNGVEWREMESDFSSWKEGKSNALAKHNLDPNKFHFLFIGNGYLRKGLDILLEGLALLPTRDFHLSVVGKEKRIDSYRKKAARLGLNRSVTFFGWQKEMRPFYQLADTLAIPSFYDPFANVTVEAIAMGVFVLSSQFNGGSEIVTDQNGHIIQNIIDPSAMIQSLSIAMRRPKTDHSAFICRKSIEHLDFSKQLNRLIDACG